ncbi:hypothetical protein V3C99_019173 [Haemonchus contortus]
MVPVLVGSSDWKGWGVEEGVMWKTSEARRRRRSGRGGGTQPPRPIVGQRNDQCPVPSHAPANTWHRSWRGGRVWCGSVSSRPGRDGDGTGRASREGDAGVRQNNAVAERAAVVVRAAEEGRGRRRIDSICPLPPSPHCNPRALSADDNHPYSARSRRQLNAE